MRFFNTAGPVRCEDHYCLDPLKRFDLQEILTFITQKKYFVLHAPRQTGKTSCLLALMKYLNNKATCRCLYVNVEAAQAARENVKQAMMAILSDIASNAFYLLGDDFPKNNMHHVLEESGEFQALNSLLTLWAHENSLPLVLLIDEIDSLTGDTLISVLRQLRGGYNKRPELFPQSIILCGIRDVRDYRIHSSREKSIITGGSAFNIKAASLRLDNFDKEEVKTLYMQHTDETGQEFDNEAVELCWELTNGQPWLVNALGYEVTFNIKENRNSSKTITKDMLERAKENIILRRETHIDQLADKLKEERIHKIISPMLEGSRIENITEDDIQYALDLGLIRRSPDGLVIANPIYREVIPRYLTIINQYNFESFVKPVWYINEEDGRLNFHKLLESFQEFFRENSEHWVERFQYKEAGAQLLLQAFLQRIINSGGSTYREYGLGRMRTDLLVIWPYKTGIQKVVIEIKLLHKSRKNTIENGLEQTHAYMERCGTNEGHLVIFDKKNDTSWDEKIFKKEIDYREKKITVWGM
jgi:hypothetical protein